MGWWVRIWLGGGRDQWPQFAVGGGRVLDRPTPSGWPEVLEISAVIHDPDAKSRRADVPGPAITRITNSSHALAGLVQ